MPGCDVHRVDDGVLFAEVLVSRKAVKYFYARKDAERRPRSELQKRLRRVSCPNERRRGQARCGIVHEEMAKLVGAAPIRLLAAPTFIDFAKSAGDLVLPPLCVAVGADGCDTAKDYTESALPYLLIVDSLTVEHRRLNVAVVSGLQVAKT